MSAGNCETNDQPTIQLQTIANNQLTTADMSSEATEQDTETSVRNDVEELIQPETASVFDSLQLQNPTSRLKIPLSSEDENVLKYFVMLRPTGLAATVLAKVCISLYQGGQKCVKDYYLTELGLSNAQYRKAFTTHERDLLENNSKWDLLDITFLYKLLQRVCGLSPPADKKWAEPQQHEFDELEHQLYLVKCERNFLAHETVTLTDQQLQNRAKNLKSSLETILCKLGSRINVDFSSDISLMKKQMDEVLNTMSKYSLQSYQEELEELRSSIVTKMIHEAQTELFPHYLNLWSSAEVWWFKVPGHNSDDNVPSEDELFTDITIKDLKGDELQIKDFLLFKTSDGMCPQIKIIEGIAGIGKSHICKYILFKWASQEEEVISLLGVDIVIFIQCYTITSKSLREFLTEELLQNTCSTLRHDDVIPALQNCQVMFIIDGIDEAGANAKAVIKEVSMKFPNNKVVITCRPEFTEMAKSLMSMQHKNVYTFVAKGFNGDQQWDYVNKLIAKLKFSANDEKRTPSKFSQEINELHEHLSTLLCMPLTIIMLVLLWINDSDSINVTTTVTRIHQQTIDMKVKQLARRIQRKSGERRHISTIERICRKWLSVLSKVAWETLSHNTQILDEESVSALTEEANTHDIDPVDALSSFLKCTVLEKMFGTEYNWEFFHKAFQEYLTALHLSDNHKNLKSYFTEWESKKHLPTQEPQDIEYTKESNIITPNPLTSTNSYPSTSTDLHAASFNRSTRRTRGGVFSCKSIFMLCFRSCCSQKSSKRAERKRKTRHRFAQSEIGTYEMGLVNLRKKTSRGFPRKSVESDYENVTIFKGKAREEEDKYTPYYYGLVDDGESRCSKEMEESPYTVTYDNPNATSKNTLQFLAAMEAAKDQMDIDYMRDIIMKFDRVTLGQWDSWAIFLKECGEQPVVCQLMKEVLNNKTIDIYSRDLNDTELQAIEYLVNETQFQPSILNLWITKREAFPQALNALLHTLVNVSPMTKVDLTCNFHHSLDLMNSLVSIKELQQSTVTIIGTLEEKDMDSWIILMKSPTTQETQLKVQAITETFEDLSLLAHCCKSLTSLPTNVALELRMHCVTEDMLNLMCHVLDAYSWQKSLTLTSTDMYLRDKVKCLQELLTKALHQSSIHLIETKMVVEAYAEYNLNQYEEMAYAISGEVPCAVVFENGADGDDISLILHGEKKNLHGEKI